MKRRDFLQLAGLAAGSVALPLPRGARILPGWDGSLTPIPTADKRQLADAALRPRERPAPPTPTSASAAT